MDEIVAQVKALAASSDDADRIKIQSGLRNLQRSLETPFETMMRLSGPVGSCSRSRRFGELALTKY